LFLISEEVFSLCLHIAQWLAIVLSYIAFTWLQYVPTILYFLRTLIVKGYWILLKAFLHLLEIIMWFCPWFCLCAIFWLSIHICWNQPRIPGMKPIWS
jgi:hypothetical protein